MKAQINQLHLNFGFFLHQLVLAILLIFVMDTVSVSQTTLFVVNGDDNGPGSLRQTLSDAANNDTIRFMAGVDTVYLTSAELLIDKSIVLSGDPAYTCVIKQDTIPKFRIFRIQSTDSLHVEFYNLSITKGHAPDGDAADLHGKHGGGIFVPDSCHDLMLTNCIIRENQAGDGFRTYSASITGSGGSGGGIYSLSKIELFNCQFNNNAAGKVLMLRAMVTGTPSMQVQEVPGVEFIAQMTSLLKIVRLSIITAVQEETPSVQHTLQGRWRKWR